MQHAKKAWQLLALALIAMLGAELLVAYGNNSATPASAPITVVAPTTVAQAPTITQIPPVPQPAGSIKVTFWFGLTGSLGNVVQQVVNKYNSSQTPYYLLRQCSNPTTMRPSRSSTPASRVVRCRMSCRFMILALSA